ncbi:MAG: RlmE family RNA methyltransferase [Alphaproteobacteria bacterium]|nr:RlmE family RNA methyltransferase [Alphaproteobacteria bacterium]
MDTQMIGIKNKKLTESSKKWLQRQMNDPYVEKAQKAGYRSRASYKILEIQRRFKIFDKHSIVLDLGAAPGGWSQVVANIAKKVIAIDLLDMEPIQNVQFIKGDFTEEKNMQILIGLLENEKADTVLSDMAPNTCGIKKIDHLRIINLLEDVYAFSTSVLKPGGSLVAKVFQGGATNELLRKFKQSFTRVRHFKPIASRKESSEMYLIAQGYKN